MQISKKVHLPAIATATLLASGVGVYHWGYDEGHEEASDGYRLLISAQKEALDLQADAMDLQSQLVLAIKTLYEDPNRENQQRFEELGSQFRSFEGRMQESYETLSALEQKFIQYSK